MSANQLDHRLKAVLATYRGFLKHPEFKAIALEGLALVRRSGFSKMLVDTSQTKVIQQESQQWIEQVWFPSAEEAGVRHMAFLIPKDFFGKVSVEATNKFARQRSPIAIEYFESRDQAQQWLQQQP